ncbi:MAG TPA: GreA/GreB family elongation factor [Candidatus Limnocylindrales bacterium]|nr:GreA/GreB family elongation factor [Candidatus Limnocylindrales bacterium]
MSKAFTREIDDAPEPVIKPSPSVLPPCAKNYITTRGMKNLRREFLELSAQPPSSQILQRLCDLQNSLLNAVVIEPPPPPCTQVQFGATVSVRNQQGVEMDYAIVGVDETDLGRNHTSWISPVAKALIKRRVGERIRFRTPAGEQNWEIIKVVYDDANSSNSSELNF